MACIDLFFLIFHFVPISLGLINRLQCRQSVGNFLDRRRFHNNDLSLQDFIMIELIQIIHKFTTPEKQEHKLYTKRTAPFNVSFTSNRLSVFFSSLLLLNFSFRVFLCLCCVCAGESLDRNSQCDRKRELLMMILVERKIFI